jgi:hypothetical protein
MDEHMKLEDLGPAVQRALLTQELKRLRAADLNQERRPAGLGTASDGRRRTQ